jgi:hypothetical protein
MDAERGCCEAEVWVGDKQGGSTGMSANQTVLLGGGTWTYQDFENHYLGGSGAAVFISMEWYMTQGPGRYFHPGMFDGIKNIVANSTLAPGLYTLDQLATPAELRARITVTPYTIPARASAPRSFIR